MWGGKGASEMLCEKPACEIPGAEGIPVWPWRTGRRAELLLQVVLSVWCFGAAQPCGFSSLCGFDCKSCVGLTEVSACFGSVLELKQLQAFSPTGIVAVLCNLQEKHSFVSCISKM